MSNWKTHPPGIHLVFYAVFLLCMIFAAYYPVLNNFFIGDDAGWLYRALLLKENPNSLFQTIAGKYRPLPILMFSIEYKLFGMHAPYYYAATLFLHWLNALVILFLTHALIQRTTILNAWTTALMCSFLYAFLFMNYEALFWISLTHDLLNALFCCLCIYFFIQFCDSHETKWYMLSFLCFVMSLLCKENSIMTPVALTLCLLYTGNAKNKLFIAALLPYLSLCLLFFFPNFSLAEGRIYAFRLQSLKTTFYHIGEAVRATFGFSQNNALKSMSSFPALQFPLAIAKFLLLASFSWITYSVMFSAMKARENAAPLLKTSLFCFMWCVVTFFPYSLIPWLSSWDWLLFSPGYHYFYISSYGVALFIAVLLSAVWTSPRSRRLSRLMAGVCIGSLFFANIIPARHVERAYGYHGEHLRYLLSSIQNASLTSKNARHIVLVNFPDDYIGLHGHGLPKFMQMMGLAFTEENIHWLDKKNMLLHRTSEPALYLLYKRPLSIEDKTREHRFK